MQHGVLVCVCAYTQGSLRVRVISCTSAHADAHMWICACVSCAGLRFRLLSSALKLMIRGPENQQIRPSARHNGGADLLVDVFENRSSFFSVSTSLPPHTDAFRTQTPALTPLMKKLVRLCVGKERSASLHLTNVTTFVLLCLKAAFAATIIVRRL